MTTPSLVAPLVPRRAQLARYSGWLFRDFAINIGIISVVLFGLLGLLSLMQIHAMQEMLASRRVPMEVTLASKVRAFLETYQAFLSVAPIICVSGLASQDRTMGFSRFLFAKPVSVRTYYAELLLVRLIGYLVLGAALVTVYSFFEPPALSWKMLVAMTLSFVAMGGIVFLFSVLTRHDGLIAIAFVLVGVLVWGHWGDKTGIGHWATYLFPPSIQSGSLHNWSLGLDSQGGIAQVDFPWKWSTWNAGYGLACGLLGLYLLRRVPLTKA